MHCIDLGDGRSRHLFGPRPRGPGPARPAPPRAAPWRPRASGWPRAARSPLADFGQLCRDMPTLAKIRRARSRRYKNRFLRPAIHFTTLFTIYKICTLLRWSKFKLCGFYPIFAILLVCKILRKFNSWILQRLAAYSPNSVIYGQDLRWISSELHEITDNCRRLVYFP